MTKITQTFNNTSDVMSYASKLVTKKMEKALNLINATCGETMCNDNTKVWPKRVYFTNRLHQLIESEYLDTDSGKDIEYIRADLVKEREDKLMNAFLELQEDEFGLV